MVKQRIEIIPDNHSNSQIVHCHPLCCAANPPTSGPNTGPDTAAIPQIAIAYALFDGLYISESEAPPVAKTGEPKKPVRNRNASNIPKLVA